MQEEMKRTLAPCRRAAALLAGLHSLYALLLVALAFCTRGVLGSAEVGSFAFWCAALAALSVMLPLLSAGTSALASRVTDRTAAALQSALLRILQRKNCEALDAYHSGQLFSRLSGDCRTVCERYTGVLPQLAGQALQLAASFAALAVIRLPLALILAACGVIAGAAGLLFRRLLKRRHLEERSASERVTSGLHEMLEHLEILRVTAAPGEAEHRFAARQSLWLRARSALRRCSIGGWTGFSMLVYLGSAATILWGALSIRNGALSFGDLTAILQLIGLFRSPVTSLTGAQSRLAQTDAARERLETLLRLPEEATQEPVPPEAKCLALELRNVTFAYDGEDQPVLKNCTAQLPLDRWTCLTGISGRGKSTLYRLILGLYQPQSGEILLKTDRGSFPCGAQTRRLFAYVPQAPTLFSGTVRENLLLAKPDASEAAVRDALALSACEFLDELPLGLDTPLGEDGQGLSYGQRQRIAIARALLKDGAQVLLLDEITSALDQATEARVLTALRGRYPAALAATHRVQLPAQMGMEFLDLDALAGGDGAG